MAITIRSLRASVAERTILEKPTAGQEGALHGQEHTHPRKHKCEQECGA